MSEPIVLRDYQKRAIDAAREAFKTAHGVMLVSPTGSGKTIIFAEIVRLAVAKEKKIAIIAHRKELLEQTSEKLTMLGVRHGVIQAADSTDPGAPVQVCSIDSMRVRELPWEPDMIVLDEAHLASAARFRSVMNRHQKSKILAVTATPFRTDGKGFRDFAQSLIPVARVQELIDTGHLVPPRWFVESEPTGLDGVKITSSGDYDLSSLEAAMNSRTIIGGIVDSYRTYADGMKAVVFAAGVSHSKAIVKQFLEAGYSAEHIDGTMDSRERRAVLENLRSGAIRIVVNANVLCEGWDEPSIACVILARPTKSLALYIQQCGRGLRPFPGKSECRILDHAGNFMQHGCITEDRVYSLDPDPSRVARRGRGRRKADRICHWCGVPWRNNIHTCRSCGLEKPALSLIEEREGALVEINPRELTIKRQWAFLVNQAKIRRRTDGRPYKRDWAFYQLMKTYPLPELVDCLGEALVPQKVSSIRQKDF